MFFVAAFAAAVVFTRVAAVATRHHDVAVALGCSAATVAFSGAMLLLRLARKRRAVERVRLIEALRHNDMDDKQFEYALAALCERNGCREVRVVGGAGDLGADVIARSPDDRRIVLQAKR